MDAAPKPEVIFTVHIDKMPKDSDLQSLFGWVKNLDPLLGLELTGVYLSRVNNVDIFGIMGCVGNLILGVGRSTQPHAPVYLS